MFAAAPENAPSADRIGLANGLLAQTGNLGNLVGPPMMAWIIPSAAGALLPSQLIGGSLAGIALVLMLLGRAPDAFAALCPEAAAGIRRVSVIRCEYMDIAESRHFR